MLIGDAAAYDRLTGWLLGSFYDGIAADIAATAPPGASSSMSDAARATSPAGSRRLGFDATGIDLDPAMIERATARDGGRYLAADVASLPFDDASSTWW